MLSLTIFVVFTLFLFYTEHLGRCERKCGEERDIVCGTDNVVYFNECFLENAACKDKTGKLRKKYNGGCEGKHSLVLHLRYWQCLFNKRLPH